MAITDNTQKIQDLLDAINSLPEAGGTELPELTNPGTASDLVEGKQLIGADGTVVTGTLNEITSGSAHLLHGATFYVDAAQDVAYMTMLSESDNLIREDVMIVLSEPASDLGDAETGDVAEGVTFTSKNGKLLTGTHTCSGTVLPDLGEDAGSESDLAKGKKLIGADGTVVTGTVATYDSMVYWDNIVPTETSDGRVRLTADTSIPYLLRNGFYICSPLSNFGNATVNDVAYGKTFTSEDGLLLEGRHNCSTDSDPIVQELTVTPTENEQTFSPSGFDGYAPVTVNPIPSSYVQPSGTKTITENGTFDVTSFAQALVNVASSGGSLPDCFTAVTFGTVTPTSDSTLTLNVNHDLGAVPNFCIWWVDEDFSETVGSTEAVGGATFYQNVNSATTDWNVHYAIRGYNSGGTFGASSGQVDNDTYFTGTTVILRCSSSYRIKAGKTYHWITGILTDLG